MRFLTEKVVITTIVLFIGLIAFTLYLHANRYTLHSTQGPCYKLDRWTGQVWHVTYRGLSELKPVNPSEAVTGPQISPMLSAPRPSSSPASPKSRRVDLFDVAREKEAKPAPKE